MSIGVPATTDMSSPEESSAESREPIGIVLARLRRRAGLTGSQLGLRARMSQAKISRIETGSITPDPADVRDLATALRADKHEVQRLVDLAERAHEQMTDWRPSSPMLSPDQRLAKLETEARIIRDFQPALIPELLQTSDYARAAYLHLPQSDMSEMAALTAASERIRRQKILADPAREFRFVLSEMVLRGSMFSPEEMLAQIQRIRRLAETDNVTISIVADESPTTLPPLHGFTILDDASVMVTVFNTVLASRGGGDVTLYRRLFDSLEASADADPGPILDTYLRRHLARLMRDLGAATDHEVGG
jgi:transcriptional regulator with XRE-family HTH domain